ncbi:SLC13 family permease [Allostreptomyces psammosilenae]|uniref:Di/tricarboxylate transporter n=1 Tax=Allostreptomyces psammosilenae TaxID=1892865 RepID=A0A853ABK9_9ACTN|nr:SLC13 family permease [Allostreptomyces psammosilenae]NYI07868.1 di/tricarboxylate transporter [Allostreptomyces psammosilenae]
MNTTATRPASRPSPTPQSAPQPTPQPAPRPAPRPNLGHTPHAAEAATGPATAAPTGTEPETKPPRRGRGPRPGLRRLATVVGVLAVGALLLWLWRATAGGALSPEGRTTLLVFAAATAAWTLTRVDDTYIALGAGLALATTGVLSGDQLFAGLGGETIWLLICAFVLAAGVTRSGLALRATVFLVSDAGTPRRLVHLTTAALVVSALAIPSTSGRAAMALPVFAAMATALRDRPRLVRALALLFPTVILLSAVATLIGAGAHLITARVLEEATGAGIGFVRWLLLGLPLALVSSHVAAELVLLLTTRRADRRAPVALSAQAFTAARQGAATGAEGTGKGSGSDPGSPLTGPLSPAQARTAALLATVVLLWCSEPLHGLSPALVALVGAVVITAPRVGTVRLKDALRGVPWSLLLFMAVTMAMGTALTASGAAEWLTSQLPRPAADAPPVVFLAGVVAVSTLAHLLVQSRSARSSVLVPLVVAAAATAGVNPVAAALASTAAAGFCHTLPSSAKAVALFSDVDGAPTYTRGDLLRLSAVLAPVTAGIVLAFAVGVWPLLGVPPR